MVCRLARKRSPRSCQKNVAQFPHRDEHQRHCTVCSVPCNRSCFACVDPVCHDCSHETMCRKCVLDADNKRSCSNDSSSSVESVCVTSEVNIVKEEQNSGDEFKKGTKLQLDAGRRSALLLSLQRVKPHFVAESLITTTVKNALSRTPRPAFPATRIRARPGDQLELELTAVEEWRLIASLRQTHTKFGSPSNQPCTRQSHTCHWW